MGTESSRRRTAQPVPVASAVLAWKSIGFECSLRVKLDRLFAGSVLYSRLHNWCSLPARVAFYRIWRRRLLS